MRKKGLKAALSILFIFAIVFSGMAFLSVQAEMVTIEEETDSDLIYHSFNGKYDSTIWDHEGSLSSDSTAKYVLKSNGWAQWATTDNMAFAYKRIAFNYSDDAELTAETTMISFDGSNTNAGAGIMFRTGLNPDSACVMMHFRPGCVMVTYRSADGNTSSQGKTTMIATSSLYPATFKLTVVKGSYKVKCYYKVGSGAYTEFATVPFVYGSEIYAGISCYSQDPNFISTSKFTTFHYLLQAPEGYTIIDDGTSGATSSEEEIRLPEDLPPQENVLLRETFTDNSLVNNNGEEQNDVTNPIWKGSTDRIDIQTNEELTNRYAYEYMADSTYYYAGDQAWTDYKTSYDLYFTNEYSEDEPNEFYAFVRTTDIVQYGYQYYYVLIKKKVRDTVVELTLGQSEANHDLSVTGYVSELEKITLTTDYDTLVGKWQNLTIETFDNRITVYWNGEAVIDFYDNTDFVKPEGCVGFGTNRAAVMVDNITVTKMEDLLGGDYDNRIGGNWNEMEPAFLDRFKEEGAVY